MASASSPGSYCLISNWLFLFRSCKKGCDWLKSLVKGSVEEMLKISERREFACSFGLGWEWVRVNGDLVR